MKLNVALHIGNEKEYIKECLWQVEKIADKIIVVIDTESYDGTKEILEEKAKKDKRYNLYYRKYDYTPQKQYILKKCPKDEWVLFLDGDEVLSDECIDINKIITLADKGGIDCIDIKGHHFIYHLRFEDAQFPEDWWKARLFKNNGKIKFEGKNHAITTGFKKAGRTENFRIFHMGYVKHLSKIMERYNENLDYGLQIHTTQYINHWKNGHLLGTFPIRPSPINTIPNVLKKKFRLEDLDDILYFENRQKLEVKHFLDAAAIFSYFKPKKVLMHGVGFGQRVHALLTYGVDITAYDKSLYAVKSNPLLGFIKQGYITKIHRKDNFFDLVIAYDVLEHLTDKELVMALDELVRVCSKYILVSIPFIGNPNLDSDPTHIQRKTQVEWEQLFIDRGVKIIPTPQSFPFANQIIIGEKK